MQAIKNYLDRYISINQAELDYFLNLMTAETHGRKEYLLRQGEVCRKEYFILNGLLRSFYIDEKGVERIALFGIENWWFTDPISFSEQSPSLMNIQAIEETTILSISKKNLEQAFLKLPKIERLFRLIAEKRLVAQQRSSHLFMKAASKERYFHLVKSIPNFAQRVPQYMLASYLNITPEYLSELRKSSH